MTLIMNIDEMGFHRLTLTNSMYMLQLFLMGDLTLKGNAGTSESSNRNQTVC